MLTILLPPSETKQPGGAGAPLAPGDLLWPELDPLRTQVTDALVALAASPERTQRALKLSDRQLPGALADNATLRRAPTMPAVDRYTGVLYDALGAEMLDEQARRWLGSRVRIHTAPFGVVGALDGIPSYRLGASASVPGLPPLRRLWAGDISARFEEERPALVLDLRSEAYVSLGPVPPALDGRYVRVVADEGGHTRALNHFNKHAKGALVRLLARTRPALSSWQDLHAWADGEGVVLRAGAPGELELVADSVPAEK